MTGTENVHQHEIHKFGAQAQRWSGTPTANS